jgi:hypothetical protein
MIFLAMSITEYFRAYYTNKYDCRVVEYIDVGLFWREDFCLIIYISVKQHVYREINKDYKPEVKIQNLELFDFIQTFSYNVYVVQW